MTDAATWFCEGLGSRIDSIETALRAAQSRQPGAAETLVEMARTLVGPARTYGLESLAGAAESVCACPPAQLGEVVAELLQTLGAEAARHPSAESRVLVVGCGDAEVPSLIEALASDHRSVRHVASGSEAERIINESGVSLIVLQRVLPDMDGRDLLARLRDRPSTASVPVALVTGTESESLEQEFALKAGACFRLPEEREALIDWVNAMLRRSHEGGRNARRDSLTGLMNRAAFCEVFDRMLQEEGSSPITLALLAVQPPTGLPLESNRATCEYVMDRVAGILTRSLRDSDVLARWDYAEFAVLFPGEDEFGGQQAVAKLITRVQETDFTAPEGHTIRIGLSAGITDVESGGSYEDALAQADRQLLQARASGGNRVVGAPGTEGERIYRVLLASSDAVTAQVLDRLFAKEAFETGRADSFEAAKRKLSGDDTFDLIVVDESLSGIADLSVIADLRALPSYAEVPIVALLKSGSEDSVDAALECGASDYMMRPFSPFALLTRIHRLLSRGMVAATVSRRRYRLLIVDMGTAPLLLAASSVHQRGGFDVYLAKGGKDGLSRFMDIKPDAVVVDVRVADPDIKGFIGSLKESAGDRAMPIIVSAEEADQEAAEKLKPQGAVGTIGKPFEPLTLASNIEHVLGIDSDAPRATSDAQHLNDEIQRILALDS